MEAIFKGLVNALNQATMPEERLAGESALDQGDAVAR
jgi:hypothetical protein